MYPNLRSRSATSRPFNPRHRVIEDYHVKCAEIVGEQFPSSTAVGDRADFVANLCKDLHVQIADPLVVVCTEDFNGKRHGANQEVKSPAPKLPG